MKIVIDIDDEPKEVGWEITTEDGDVVVEHDAGYYKEEDKYSHLVELEPGSYIFSMKEFDDAEGTYPFVAAYCDTLKHRS